MLTRSDVETLYTVDPESGIIRDPGRFESCHWPCVVLHDLVGQGLSDDVLYDSDTVYDVFFMSDEDRHVFGLLPEIYAAAVWVSEQGFAYSQYFNEEDYSSFELSLLSDEGLSYD